MTVITRVATSSPPNPYARPKFQPKKSPEMTAATPSAHSDQTPACRLSRRFSKYSAPASRYVTTPTFRPSCATEHLPRFAAAGSADPLNVAVRGSTVMSAPAGSPHPGAAVLVDRLASDAPGAGREQPRDGAGDVLRRPHAAERHVAHGLAQSLDPRQAG